jgi:hypothetical protein
VQIHYKQRNMDNNNTLAVIHNTHKMLAAAIADTDTTKVLLKSKIIKSLAEANRDDEKALPAKPPLLKPHQPVDPKFGIQEDLPRIPQDYASERYNNLSSMGPGPSSIKYGSNKWGTLNDTYKNVIAQFPTPEQGAAAAFDLLGTDPTKNARHTGYLGKNIGKTISEWTGNTSGKEGVDAYAKKVAESIGLNPNDVITSEMLHSPKGQKFLETMAYMEAGHKVFPMPEGGYARGQAMWEEQQKLETQELETQKSHPIKSHVWNAIHTGFK